MRGKKLSAFACAFLFFFLFSFALAGRRHHDVVWMVNANRPVIEVKCYLRGWPVAYRREVWRHYSEGWELTPSQIRGASLFQNTVFVVALSTSLTLLLNIYFAQRYTLSQLLVFLACFATILAVWMNRE